MTTTDSDVSWPLLVSPLVQGGPSQGLSARPEVLLLVEAQCLWQRTREGSPEACAGSRHPKGVSSPHHGSNAASGFLGCSSFFSGQGESCARLKIRASSCGGRAFCIAGSPTWPLIRVLVKMQTPGLRPLRRSIVSVSASGRWSFGKPVLQTAKRNHWAGALHTPFIPRAVNPCHRTFAKVKGVLASDVATLTQRLSRAGISLSISDAAVLVPPTALSGPFRWEEWPPPCVVQSQLTPVKNVRPTGPPAAGWVREGAPGRSRSARRGVCPARGLTVVHRAFKNTEGCFIH